jgi:hypothetical protein
MSEGSPKIFGRYSFEAVIFSLRSFGVAMGKASMLIAYQAGKGYSRV